MGYFYGGILIGPALAPLFGGQSSFIRRLFWTLTIL